MNTDIEGESQRLNLDLSSAPPWGQSVSGTAASAVGVMASSAALPLASDSLKHRMDQFLAAAAAGMARGGPPSMPPQPHPTPTTADSLPASAGDEDGTVAPAESAQSLAVSHQQGPTADIYQYHDETSPTSAGSGSGGEEDDRESGELSSASGKRLGGVLNGFSSKKRRKQSKPIRIGADGEGESPNGVEPGMLPSQEGPGAEADEEQRRYSHETDEDKGTGNEEGEVKETPLNLSSRSGDDEEEGELKSPSLRVLGAELMQTHGLEGFKGLPGLPGPGGIPASLYQSMLPFGLPPFPFPFPPVSGAGGTPPAGATNGKTPGGGNGSRQQIFNPEAYCELCNKEFCNKYFLKTHKANKHGIYSDGVPPPPQGTGAVGGDGSKQPGSLPLPPPADSRSPQQSSSASTSGPTPPTTSEPSQVGGPTTPKSLDGSPFSGAFIAANMGNLRPPFMPLSPGGSPSPNANQPPPTKDANNSLDANRAGSPKLPLPPLPPTSVASQLFPPGKDFPGLPNNFRQNLEERERLMQREKVDRELGELRKSLESPRGAAGALGALGGFNPLLFGALPPLDSLRKEEAEIMRKEAAAAKKPNLPQQKGPFSSDKLRQMGVINADAFCEICCKEFCNKYFLRVHKLKKHGICSPDLPPEKVTKILNQMAKEAGKSGNPPPPIVRPPMIPGGPAEKLPLPPLATAAGPMGIRPPGLLNLPNLEPIPGLPRDPNMPPLHLGGEKERPRPDMNRKDLDNSQLPGQERSSSRSSEIKAASHNESGSEVIRINEDSNEEGIRDHSTPIRREGTEEGCESKNSLEEGTDPTAQTAAAAAAAAAAGEDLQRLHSMIMELSSKKAGASNPNAAAAPANEGICKVCGKDMENKYFLRAHMMNEHGVLHIEEPPQLPIRPDDSIAAAAAAATSGGSPGVPPHQQQPEANGGHPGGLPESAVASFEKDFAAKFLQQMQKGLLPPIEPGDEQNFLERVKNELAAGAAIKGKMDQVGKDPNRRPASLSRSYCEICKKELCNKYFMKTHMLKMHGINIDDGGRNGSICQICKKDLCSKYFLKVHMQTAHGIVDEEPLGPMPPGMGTQENGGPPPGVPNMFQGLFPMGSPPPELLGLPPGSTPEGANKEKFFNRLMGAGGETTPDHNSSPSPAGAQAPKERGMENKTDKPDCTLCGEVFPDIVALQVHIIKNHGAFPPEATGLHSSSSTPKKTQEEGLPKGLPTIPKVPSFMGGTTPGADPFKLTEKQQPQRLENEMNHQASSPTKPVSNKTPKNDSGKKSDQAEKLAKNALAMAGIPPEVLKQMPHLEMLQRQMQMTAGFPGLLSPLLAGGLGALPGFPNPLQHLLQGGAIPPLPGMNGSKEGDTGSEPSSDLQTTPNHDEISGSESPVKKAKKKSFKCSKCKQKFGDRLACLQHIKEAHSIKRKLSFNGTGSPNKMSKTGLEAVSASKANKARAQYVKELMEMLKVPTSRGTALDSGDESSPKAKHIMQPFLLKGTPNAVAADENGEGSEATDANDNNFVPSLVYLPVAKKVSEQVTVSFSLTPSS